jgi:hypothetical protein
VCRSSSQSVQFYQNETQTLCNLIINHKRKKNFDAYNQIVLDLLPEKNTNVKLNLADFLASILTADFKKRTEEKVPFLNPTETLATFTNLTQLLFQDDNDFRYKFLLKQKSVDYLVYYLSTAN